MTVARLTAQSHVEKDEVEVKDLHSLFHPRGLAVVGTSANPDKIGHQILKNIIDGRYAGEIYPIHPTLRDVLGKRAYPSVLDAPGDIDLAVIAVKASRVPDVVRECARKGVKSVIVISSGFAETGNAEEEKKLKKFVDEHHIALLGPNALGLIYAPSRLNATFGPRSLLPGKIAFISQSGALAIALMGWTVMEKIGLAALVSVGNKADIADQELIEYFNRDDHVKVIQIYMEGIRDGRRFMRTKVKKPIVVLKVGRSQRGEKAALSHTGSLAGSDRIYDAAFRQMGILRAGTFHEAFGWSRTLSLPLPEGEEGVILTNGGGLGVRTSDECEDAGIKLLDAPAWLEEKFRKTMPGFGSTGNPVDMTGQAREDHYRQAGRTAFVEDKIKAVIILYCETVITDPLNVAKIIEEEYEKIQKKKPLVVAMVGGEKTRQAIQYLNERHVPAFTTISEAVSALKALYTWKEISRRPGETAEAVPPPPQAIRVIENVKAEKRNALLEDEALTILEACGISVPRRAFAKNLDEALQAGGNLYPLAMKICSPDIIHKTDVGGVALNIHNGEELLLKFNAMTQQIKSVRPGAEILGVHLMEMVRGIECVTGLSHDPQFGPVVMFGLGGVFVEALKNVSFRIVPFGRLEARRLIDEIRGADILKGFRGMAVDRASLVEALCSVQKLASCVREADINPLIVNEKGCFAVDARIIL